MRRSIGVRIFMTIFLFALMMIGIIAVSTRFILPSYYLQQQLNTFDEAEMRIRQAYLQGDQDQVISQMEDLRNTINGQLYYDGENMNRGRRKGNSYGGMMNDNREKFSPQGDVTVYSYTDKTGRLIHVIGVKLDDDYLVYEGNIQSLNQAMTTLMHFIFILLGVILLVAVLVSYVLSKRIASPIKELNQLAESMKSKTIDPQIIVKENDELGQLNQTLNELYEELRGNIYKLNAELQKERKTEKLKKRFLAQATHELKTPIAVIKGYAEILYDGMYKDEEERNRFLKNIYEESETVSTLILDVLDYTKLETGNEHLDLEAVRVSQIVNQMGERYRHYIESQGIRFDLQISIQNNLYKEIDRRRFEQVYKNLISNAVEHAKSVIKVEMTQMNQRLKMSVFNDGDPILEEDLPFIFESFYKKRGKKKGTGLGLSIVKEIMLLHQGEYWVENKPEGVNFVVIF